MTLLVCEVAESTFLGSATTPASPSPAIAECVWLKSRVAKARRFSRHACASDALDRVEEEVNVLVECRDKVECVISEELKEIGWNRRIRLDPVLLCDVVLVNWS
ncbi:hypothetical protein Syun_026384 [Stephania yunnanensis]|uniref:Uncharacterized protein n=1 Tax=Stephania yunnanensis TaxID=152371 RepID=A0AAP0F2B3_9MAGN